MPEEICKECGKRIFHENETTLKIQVTIHSKFCRKKPGEIHSYMHKQIPGQGPFDPERENDMDGKPVLKR